MRLPGSSGRLHVPTYIRLQRVGQEWAAAAARIAGASPAPTRPPSRGKLEHRARRADLAAVIKPRLGKPITTDAAHLRVVRSCLAKATPRAPTPRKPLWERGARPTVAYDPASPKALRHPTGLHFWLQPATICQVKQAWPTYSTHEEPPRKHPRAERASERTSGS